MFVNHRHGKVNSLTGLHLDPDDLSVRQVSKLVSAGGQLLGMSAVEVGDVLQFVDDCPIQQVKEFQHAFQTRVLFNFDRMLVFCFRLSETILKSVLIAIL